MADNAPTNPYTPKLGKSETSRLKTETSRQRKPTGNAAAEKTVVFTPPPAPPPPPAGEAGSTATIADPMARRDTSTGKLRRVQSPDETASALAPAAGGTEPKRTETVRLKVVRNTRSELQNVVPEGQAAAAPPRPAGDTLAVAPPAAATPETPPPVAKRATSTVRVDPPRPPTEAEETVADAVLPETAAADETQASSAFSNTGTSTIKLQVQKPSMPAGMGTAAPAAPGKVATATLKIRPPSAPGPAPATEGVPGARPAANKDATATLKIRLPAEAAAPATAATAATAAPSGPVAPPPRPPGAPAEGSRDVTAVLKVRPGGVGAKPAPAPEAESGATVKIRPPVLMTPKPAPAVSADDETHVGVQAPPVAAPPPAGEKPKMSLRLRKDEEAKPAKRDVTIPGLGEKQPPAADAAKTVAVSPAAEPETPDAGGADNAAATVVMAPADEATTVDKKKGLRLKGGKTKEEEAAAASTPTPTAQAQEEEDARAAMPAKAGEVGPGRLAAAAALVAFAGVGALLVRLLLDFRRYL